MKNKGVIILIVALVIIAIGAGGILGYKIYTDPNRKPVETVAEEVVEEKEEEPMVVDTRSVKIYSGKSRPIAVMIDNHSGAWPQANINQTYMVYEIIVEGGETRLMALFKGKNLEQIGPIRSSRHYFLDYAMENDAIYTHYGWSPRAESDIKSLGINNLNGIIESSNYFWRVKDKKAPHNAFSNTEKIMQMAENHKYRTTSDKKSVLNYSVDEVNLDTQDSMIASNINIPYSTLHSVKYEYNPDTQRYTRYARGKLQTDYVSGDAITTKNIIITFCANFDLKDNDKKGRQDLSNIGTFDGYYITNGKAIKIKCTKSSREAQTVYKDLQGNEINVNDGNTFVNICPTGANVSIQ